jgi:hypothetical protein
LLSCSFAEKLSGRRAIQRAHNGRIDVFAVHDRGVRLIDPCHTAVAPEPSFPLRAKDRRTAILQSAKKRATFGRRRSATPELGDAEAVVEIGPSRGGRDGCEVLGFV